MSKNSGWGTHGYHIYIYIYQGIMPVETFALENLNFHGSETSQS